jgi:glycine/D-amino acid oxidase-like deaminating enzyme
VELANTVPGRGNIGRALKFPRQGQFNVVKYCRDLANAIIRSGKGQIFTYTHAQGFHGGKNAKIVTSDGFTVQCENIVVATNVPVNDRLTMITKMEPRRTYAIAARVRKESVPLALF